MPRHPVRKLSRRRLRPLHTTHVGQKFDTDFRDINTITMHRHLSLMKSVFEVALLYFLLFMIDCLLIDFIHSFN